MKRTLLIAGLALLSSAAHATHFYTAQTITQVATGPAYGGDVVIKLSGHNSNAKPACATDNTWSLRLNATTEVGKQVLSMALLAQTTGIEVDLAGENFCTSNVTTLRWIRFE